MNLLSTTLGKDEARARNAIAAALSIVPGLGHVYKGHYAAGFIWMFVGMPVAAWIGILFGLATAGFGLLFPVICWGALALDAYYEKDLRGGHHHFLPPEELPAWTDDEMSD